MTLLEVAVALAIFSLGAVGLVECHSLFNGWAARNRCDAAAQAILRAKVAKVLTDPWDAAVPPDCVVTTGVVTEMADATDVWDAGTSAAGAPVVLLAATESPQSGIVTGTITRQTRALDALTPTVVVDFTFSYVFRGKTYVQRASVARARDR